MASHKEPYSRDEWIVLLDYFFSQPEPTHTDSHPQLVEFAKRIGRSPGSVDSSLRNIKRQLTGQAGFEHGAKGMKEVVREFRNNKAGLRWEAIQAMTRIQGTKQARGE